jgi:post-segregation antitoxin (ccd killing protein)
MPKAATPITLSSKEEQTLRHWMQAHKTERRLVERARIVLLAASGLATTAIAQQLDTPPSRVSKWRLRFAEQRLAGLIDRPRAGKPARYNEATRKRILTMLAAATQLVPLDRPGICSQSRRCRRSVSRPAGERGRVGGR